MSDQSWCCRCKKVTPDSTKIEYVRTKNDKLRKICNCECGTKKSTFVNQRTGGALTDDEKTEANYWSRIAASAYENPEDRAKYISEAGINDLEIDPEDEEFQDERTAVYKNKETGKRIYGMRGTNFKDKKDLKADAWIVAGDVTKSGVYKHWDKQLGGLIDKYGKENVERLVGHSLAGRTALELGKKYDIASESFNTGSAPSDVTKNVLNKTKCVLFPRSADCVTLRKNRNWLVHTDPVGVSATISPYKNRFIYPRASNPHTIKNWFY